jgi:aryl-alcohol dehydrogenase-like predicted oxidoreductase
MRYRSLGNSGLIVSVTGLGCNNFGRRIDLDATREVVNAALEAGVTLLDTADMYGNGGGSEELLGEVLAGRRDEVVLATKFGTGTSTWAMGPRRGQRAAGPTSGAPLNGPCAGSGPTTWTCTSSTPPTR